MSGSEIKICDNCKTQSPNGVIPNVGIIITPLKWIRIFGGELLFRVGIDKKDVNKKIERLALAENGIDFCSKECAMVWFEKQLDNLVGKKK